MSGILFARGRQGETALTEVTAAGATSIILAGANQVFALGQTLLVSEADDSETEWLGKVTAVSAQSVGFSRPLAQSKNTGARLWRAAATLTTPAEATLPLKRALRTGVTDECTRGGQWMAVQTAEPREELTLTLEGLTPAVERAVVNWLGDQAGWGLWPFTLIEPDGALAVVRLAGGEERPVQRQREGGGRVRLTLPLWIVGEGSYQ
jgi:hypothetical protein